MGQGSRETPVESGFIKALESFREARPIRVVWSSASRFLATFHDLEAVKAALPAVPVFANTGVRHGTVADVMRVVDGCVAGSSLKVDGDSWNAVDPARADELMPFGRAARGRRGVAGKPGRRAVTDSIPRLPAAFAARAPKRRGGRVRPGTV